MMMMMAFLMGRGEGSEEELDEKVGRKGNRLLRRDERDEEKAGSFHSPCGLIGRQTNGVICGGEEDGYDYVDRGYREKVKNALEL
ncbi:hypothetical protein L3Y34_004045 [Caenorhabditis briggsae]|uniref:Uncharacterized protein n=1 Tax=Caenorhabditis briggsae TaxID=6238 RepID=A0AAE9AEB8_CAEBR|nr:hypothetical protein L3Y34_004045 [Caenorhabditis briggsae]